MALILRVSNDTERLAINSSNLHMWAPMALNMIGLLALVKWELVKRSYVSLEGSFLEDHMKLCIDFNLSNTICVPS